MTGAGNRTDRVPRVTIGLPVYNGERYLAEALDSLLAQTFADFELIISDNASTDRTGEICRKYAARDPRIRYQRLECNIGGFRNHNRLVGLARGEYFTWAAHDDLREPEHLARCVTGLDADRGAVLCFTAQRMIDHGGATLPSHQYLARTDSPDPRVRWHDLLLCDWVYTPNYGLVRTEVLRQTRLLTQHADSDRNLLAELGLRGRFLGDEEPLFLRRRHAGASRAQFTTLEQYTTWFEPGWNGEPVFPFLGRLWGFLMALYRSPIPLTAKLAAHGPVVRWVLDARNSLGREVLTSARLAWARVARRGVVLPRSPAVGKEAAGRQ